jgi:hypothetical protein
VSEVVVRLLLDTMKTMYEIMCLLVLCCDPFPSNAY